MNTLDSLPAVPPHEMRAYMKEFKKIDQQLANNEPGNIIEELRPPEEKQIEASQERSTPVEHEEEHEVQEATSKDNRANIRALRERAERAERESDRAQRAERERDELLQKFRDMEMQRLQQHTQVSHPAEEEDFSVDLAPDALAEGKHVAKIYKKMQAMESQLKKYQQQTSQNMMEAQLKAQYPDFDSVVSKLNVEELRRAHPAIAQALATAASTDAYSAASSAYTIIKEMGIHKSMQEATMTRNILKENASKPRSAQAASPQRGSTPLSQVNEFIEVGKPTAEYQQQLLKEMNAARLQGRR